MANLKLKTTLLAASVALSLLAPAAQAEDARAPAKSVQAPTVSQVIAEQGNAALELIHAEMKAAVKLVRVQAPVPARATRVSAPAPRSTPATAALAK